MSDIFDTMYGIEDFRDSYQNWLKDTLAIDARYDILFDQLYDTAFEWVLDNDGNRESDARHLREEYAYRAKLMFRDEWLLWDASVLEVLASLSFDMVDCVCEYPGDFEASTGFWIMMENLGLDNFSDDIYMTKYGFEGFDRTRKDVERILNRWLKRRFTKTGKGSPFPRRRGVEDQRYVEMWYQLNGYVIDNGWV